jgi:hypothetical protein
MTDTEEHREVIAAILAAGVIQKGALGNGVDKDADWIVTLYRAVLERIQGTPQRTMKRASRWLP